MKRRHSRLIAMLTTGEPKPVKKGAEKKTSKSKVSPEHVHTFVSSLMGNHMHAKRVLSLASGVVGVMHSAALGVRAIGLGLAEVVGLEKKHAVKQIDRLLSNRGIDVWEEFAVWVPHVSTPAWKRVNLRASRALGVRPVRVTEGAGGRVLAEKLA